MPTVPQCTPRMSEDERYTHYVTHHFLHLTYLLIHLKLYRQCTPRMSGTSSTHLSTCSCNSFLPIPQTVPPVHPEDERYKQYVGRELEVPMGGGRTIKVIADDYVDREFGTGALKITPGESPGYTGLLPSGGRQQHPFTNVLYLACLPMQPCSHTLNTTNKTRPRPQQSRDRQARGLLQCVSVNTLFTHSTNNK